MAGYAAPATQGLASQQSGAFASNLTTSVFVKGLAKGVNERQLYALFSQFGTVVDCQVARHRSGRSAGFAVVQFARREDATRALMVMESAMLAGRRLNVRWYTPELQHSNMAGLGALGDLNKALAAMLGGPTTACPPQSAVPNMNTGALGDMNSALAQQLLVQQLANALAAQQLSNPSLPGASYLPSSTGAETWASTLDNTLSGLAGQHSSPPRAQHVLPSIPSMKESSLVDLSARSWLDGAGANDVSSHPLNAQLDSWARHSVDTSAPTYGPRRRSTQTGSRRSLEGSSLADCIVHANTSDDQVDGVSSKWCDSSLNRRASSVDCSLPTCTPPDQSDDGSCSSHCRRGSSGMNAGLGASVVLMAGVLEQQDSNGAPKLSLLDDKSETSDDLYKQQPYGKRMSSASIQLPTTLDSDSLFAKQPLLSTPTKGIAPQPSGTPVIDRNPRAGGNTGGVLRHSLSNPLNSYMQSHAEGRSPITKPGTQPFPAAGMPPAMPVFQGNTDNAARLDLNAALNLSAGLGLDGSPHVNPLNLHMEAAMRRAREAETMISHLSAMRSQALLAYAVLQHQGPNGFPTQGTAQAVAGLQGMGQLPTPPSLPGAGLGMMASPHAMNGVPLPGVSGAPTSAATNLETLMSAANMDLNSLTALVQLQQNMQNSVF